MTTYTSTEFATRVLKDLGIIHAEETPAAADLNWAIETSLSEILMLNAIGMPIWDGSSIAVPQEYLTSLSRRVGLAVAPSFGMTDIATATMAMRESERVLSLLAAARRVPRALRTDLPAYGGTFNFTTGQ